MSPRGRRDGRNENSLMRRAWWKRPGLHDPSRNNARRAMAGGSGHVFGLCGRAARCSPGCGFRFDHARACGAGCVRELRKFARRVCVR